MAIALNDMDWRGWSIKVTDAQNRPMLSVLFPQTPEWGSQRA